MVVKKTVEVEQDELAILFPSNPLMVAGEELNIKPFVFSKWAEVIVKAAGIVQIVLKHIEEHGDDALDVCLDKDNFKISPEAYELGFELLSQGGETINSLLAISARKPRAWVDELEGDEGLNLLLLTFQVHGSGRQSQY